MYGSYIRKCIARHSGGHRGPITGGGGRRIYINSARTLDGGGCRGRKRWNLRLFQPTACYFFLSFFAVVAFFCHKKRRCGALWSSIIYTRRMVLPPTYGVRAYLMIFYGCAEGAICDFFVLPNAG